MSLGAVIDPDNPLRFVSPATKEPAHQPDVVPARQATSYSGYFKSFKDYAGSFGELGKNVPFGVLNNLLVTSAELIVNVAQVTLIRPYVAPENISEYTSKAIEISKSNFWMRTWAGSLHSVTSACVSKYTGSYAEKAAYAAQYILPAMRMGGFYVRTTNNLVHEYGHLLAIRHFDPTIQTQISLNQYSGGAHVESHVFSTWWHVAQKLVGTHPYYLNEAWISAAGPAAGIAGATALLVLSHAFRNSSPQASLNMKMAAVSAILQHVEYALSAYASNPSAGHDFVAIWKYGGVSPIMATVAMLAVPIFVQLALLKLSSQTKTQPNSL